MSSDSNYGPDPDMTLDEAFDDPRRPGRIHAEDWMWMSVNSRDLECACGGELDDLAAAISRSLPDDESAEYREILECRAAYEPPPAVIAALRVVAPHAISNAPEDFDFPVSRSARMLLNTAMSRRHISTGDWSSLVFERELGDDA